MSKAKKATRQEIEARKARLTTNYPATPFTRRVVDRFLQIERWSFLKRMRKQVERIFQGSLARQFAERLQRISDFVDLTKGPLTMEAFYKICRAKDIRVFRYRRPDLEAYGQYFPQYHETRYGTMKKGDAIWLRHDLRGAFLLEVAAHEISHFCLHREISITTGKLTPFCKELDLATGQAPKSMIAEIEADLMTAMLLTKKEGLK